MKKIFSLAPALILSLLLAACGSAKAPETDTQGPDNALEASVSDASAEPVPGHDDSANDDSANAVSGTDASDEPAENQGHYPVTLTDQGGRTVTIEKEPQKLVSGYYISTSLLIALDLEEKLVGIEAKADKRAIYRRSAPALTTLPSVGSAKEFDLEGCAALEPDLVILPLRLQNAAGTLEELGIPVLLVNPEDQALLEEMILLIGAATDTGTQAQALLHFTDVQRERLSQTLAGAEAPSVYLAGNSDMLSVATDAMYQSDLIRLAGGTNVAGNLTDPYWAKVSYEQLLAWNPAYIILASDADYSVEDVLADPNLAGCDAVKCGNVYQMPGDAEAWDSPVPSGILGAVWLSGILHPDLCSQEDCAALIDEYYETFYGFVYSES